MKEKKVLDKRDQFTSSKGFILAAVGSAVGMGNIWMFPYRVGQFGGASFLIPYFIFVILIGVTGVIGEMSFGRATKSGPMNAFKMAFSSRRISIGRYIGIIPVLGSLGIAIGYTVIVGWITKYFIGSINTTLFYSNDIPEIFVNLTKPTGSLIYHFSAALIIIFILSLGISKGIEKVNKIMMPAFFVLFIILAISVSFLPNAIDGYRFLFSIDMIYFSDPKTWIYALGQAFFSLSLAGSGTLVYGSYLKDNVNIFKSAKIIALFDTLAAMLAALVIIPAVYAFGLDQTTGPGLMFITMPIVFQEMPLGIILIAVFFIAVLFAGISSLINLFESPIEALQSNVNISRKNAVCIIVLFSFTVGIILENGSIISTYMDIISIYIIPLGAILAGITFFWVFSDKYIHEQVNLGNNKEVGRWFKPASKYLFCGLSIVVYILGIIFGGIG